MNQRFTRVLAVGPVFTGAAAVDLFQLQFAVFTGATTVDPVQLQISFSMGSTCWIAQPAEGPDAPLLALARLCTVRRKVCPAAAPTPAAIHRRKSFARLSCTWALAKFASALAWALATMLPSFVFTKALAAFLSFLAAVLASSRSFAWALRRVVAHTAALVALCAHC